MRRKKAIPTFPNMGVFKLANRTIVGGVVKESYDCGIDVADLPKALKVFFAAPEMKRTLEAVLIDIKAAQEKRIECSDDLLEYMARLIIKCLLHSGMSSEEIQK
ncbi:TPA: hypothetical protein DDW35_13770, partial [Candidatus Sumerlaeota bacterium]|nr:hypothetical protein [Candidatus Sumerlaeota bacterium]